MRIEKTPSIIYTVLCLVLLNLSFGLLFINEGLFHYDSVVLAQAIEKTCATGMLQPAVNGRYGSVIIGSIMHLPFFLFGKNTDFTVRFTSVLFGALSMGILFLFVQELFGDYFQAFFCALLFSFTPFYVSPNTYGKEHSMAIFFFILSLYLLSRGLRKNSLILTGISSFILAFSLAIRESLLAATPLFFLLYAHPQISLRPLSIAFPRQRLNLRWILATTMPFALGFGLLFFSYLKGEIYRVFFIKNNTSASFLGIFSPNLRWAWSDMARSVPPPIIFFSIIAVRMVFKRDSFLALFFLAWCILMFYFGNTSSYIARYLDIVILPVYVFAAHVLSDLYANTKYRIIAFTLMAYFVLSMLFFMGPMLTFRHSYNGAKRFALYVQEKTEKNAFIIAMDESPFIEYYGKRKTLTHPIGDARKMNDFMASLNHYVKNGIPVYAIESSFTYDRGAAYKNALFTNFNVTAIGGALAEDYHRADLRLLTYYQRLFRITLKTTAPESK